MSCRESSHCDPKFETKILPKRTNELKTFLSQFDISVPSDFTVGAVGSLVVLIENVDFPHCPICGSQMKFQMNFGYYMLMPIEEYHYELVYIAQRPRHYHEWLWFCSECKLQFYPVDSFQNFEFPQSFDQKDGAKLFRKGVVARKVGYVSHHGKAWKYYKRRRSYTYVQITRKGDVFG